MRNWVFNDKYLDIRQVQTNRPIFELDIISRWSRIRVSEGDYYLLLSAQPHGFQFKEHGEVVYTADPQALPLSQREINDNERRERLGLDLMPPRNRHTIQISPEKQLEAINRFDDLIYSLLTVKNYARPMVHFQRQYRELGKKDYETITKGWLYVARTAFGKLVNALPKETKLQFMLHAMRDFDTVDFTNLKYDALLDNLKNYIEGHILSQGRLLRETERMLREDLNGLDIPVAEIGFYDEERQKADLVQTQAGLFQDLFDIDPESTLIQEIKTEVEKNEQEDRFYNMFKKRTWPLFIK